MPVARSDPRRATIVGVVGVVVGSLLILLVLFANNLGGGDEVETRSSKASFDVGVAKDRAENIRRDQTPLLFQDPAEFERPIFVQHLGDDPAVGWTAFDAANGTCVLTWRKESQDFTDCNGTRYPADGNGVHAYPATVGDDGHLVIDLSIDATTTTGGANSTK
jgi:hypothetical protein